MQEIKQTINLDNYESVNLYFQDESRFGLMSHIGSCLAVKGKNVVVKYKHGFKNTYLYGAYSPITGDSFVWEINGVSTKIFEQYLQNFSQQNPKEYKIVVIDNAGFHSTKNITVPQNIWLLNIPPYSPELNPCEQVWQYIKNNYKNQLFHSLKAIRKWLHKQVKNMTPTTIKSITSNHYYNNAFLSTFYT